MIKRTVEKQLRAIISVDEIQFGFIPGVETSDAIFIKRQLQEKCLKKEEFHTWPLWILKRKLSATLGRSSGGQ